MDWRVPAAPTRAERAFDALVWLMLVASVGLRCASLQLMEYKGDEAYFLEMAVRNASDLGSLTSLHSSQSIPNPVGFLYVIALPLAFTNDPIAIAAFIAIANVVGLGVYYYLLRTLFSDRIALWGVTLLSSAPWAMILARKIWNPDIIFPFAITFYALFFSLLHKPQRWKVYAAFLALAMLTQMQLSTWLLVPPIALYACIARPKVRWYDLLLGGALLAATHVPYVLDLLAGQPDPALQSTAARRSLADIVHNFQWATRLTTGLGFDYLLGKTGFNAFEAELGGRWLNWLPTTFAALTVAGTGLIGVPAVRAVWRDRRSSTMAVSVSDHIVAFFVLLIPCVCIELFLKGHKAQPHQLVILYPALSLFGALLMVRLDRLGSRALSMATRTLLIAVIGFHLLFIASFYSFIERRPDLIRGDYGMPYAVRLQKLGPKRFKAWEESKVQRIVYQSKSPDEARELLASHAPAQAMLAFAQRQRSWKGTPKQLYQELTPSPRPRGWPSDANRLRASLKEVSPLLSTVGVSITEHSVKGRSGYLIRVKDRRRPTAVTH
jgi:4-amino-4-deoxy-L-arabinose transferase-like glycosyltransferase